MALLIFAAIAFQFPRAGKVIGVIYEPGKLIEMFQFPRAGKVIDLSLSDGFFCPSVSIP